MVVILGLSHAASCNPFSQTWYCLAISLHNPHVAARSGSALLLSGRAVSPLSQGRWEIWSLARGNLFRFVPCVAC